VDERVIVPRSFIYELLGDPLLPWIEHNELVHRALDLCTGSGCLAIQMAHHYPAAEIDAVDLSLDALEVAAVNIEEYGLEERVRLIHTDLFEGLDDTYDLIVSNPPYISEADKDEVGLNVLTSEPHMALFAEEDGYAVYRKIAGQAEDYLTEKGKIYLEIGYKQGDGIRELLEKNFPQKRIRVLKDQFGKDRMVAMDNG